MLTNQLERQLAAHLSMLSTAAQAKPLKRGGVACWRAYLAYFVRAIQLSDAIAVDSQSTRSARCTEGRGEERDGERSGTLRVGAN